MPYYLRDLDGNPNLEKYPDEGTIGLLNFLLGSLGFGGFSVFSLVLSREWGNGSRTSQFSKVQA